MKNKIKLVAIYGGHHVGWPEEKVSIGEYNSYFTAFFGALWFCLWNHPKTIREEEA